MRWDGSSYRLALIDRGVSGITTPHVIAGIIVYYPIANAGCLLIIYPKEEWDSSSVGCSGGDSFVARV